jgi:ArsR family transcriptional regulator
LNGLLYSRKLPQLLQNSRQRLCSNLIMLIFSSKLSITTLPGQLKMETSDDSILHNDSDIAKAARCLKAMSHPLRLKILCVLGSNSVSVQDIVEQVGTSQSNISQHLAILREKDILGYKKEANRVYYFIDDERMLQLIRMMKEIFCSTADPAFNKLKHKY